MRADKNSTLDIVIKLKVEELKNTLENKIKDYKKLNEQINYTENESEKSNLQRRSNSLYSELENTAKELDELTKYIEKRESYVDKLNQTIQELQRQNEQLKRDNKDLNQQLKDIHIQSPNEQLNQQFKEAKRQNEQLNQERDIYIYKLLEYLLKNHKWGDANEETLSIINQFSSKNTKDPWNEIDIQKFPCDVLCKLDQLWTQYSNNHFGFTIQKMIWEGKRCANLHHPEEAFGNYVGWYDSDRNKWLSFSDPAFRAKIMHREIYRGILPTFNSNLEFNASLIPHMVQKIESCDCN